MLPIELANGRAQAGAPRHPRPRHLTLARRAHGEGLPGSASSPGGRAGFRRKTPRRGPDASDPACPADRARGLRAGATQRYVTETSMLTLAASPPEWACVVEMSSPTFSVAEETLVSVMPGASQLSCGPPS